MAKKKTRAQRDAQAKRVQEESYTYYIEVESLDKKIKEEFIVPAQMDYASADVQFVAKYGDIPRRVSGERRASYG